MRVYCGCLMEFDDGGFDDFDILGEGGVVCVWIELFCVDFVMCFIVWVFV